MILMQGRMFDIRVAYEFEDLDHGRTRVNQCSASTGKGLWRLLLVVLQPLTRKSVAKAARRKLEGLRACCESGTPASPGGPTRG
ncbi:MAG: hypothetical protein GY895_22055 [Phycisphaera sp.]|nr:hypothetical protein [Phycisphaera sp.]